MSLDIGIADDSPNPWPLPPTIGFDDSTEGYYWHLHPVFDDIARRTGQYIDLYGYALFKNDDLRILGEAIRDARIAAAKMPAGWRIWIGTSITKDGHSDIHKDIDQMILLSILDDLIALVAQATTSNQAIVCVGD